MKGLSVKKACRIAFTSVVLILGSYRIQAQTTPYFLTPQTVPGQAASPTQVAIDKNGNAVSIGGPPIYWTSGIRMGTPLPNAGGMQEADALNGAGQIAGTSADHIVIWRPNTSAIQLPLPNGGSVDLQDDAGEAVGVFSNGILDPIMDEYERPAYLLRGGKVYDLGVLPDHGDPNSTPLSISPNGKYIVGVADESFHTVGVSFTVGGQPVVLDNIPAPPGSPNEACCDDWTPTAAQQVTNSGVIYGFGTFVDLHHVWQWHAAMWKNGTAYDLGDLTKGGLAYSQFNDANQNGQAVGNAEYYAPFCTDPVCPVQRAHAALWNDTKIVDLGALSGDTDSNAVSINAGGVVVGSSTSASGTSRAVIWQGGKITDLNTVIPLEYRGQVVLTNASQISDAGYIEAQGHYLNSSNQTTNFLLTPSVPTSISVTSTANPASFGESITFTATVKPKSGNSIPRSYVTFADGSTVLGTAALSSIGTATAVFSRLAIGTHAIKVTFNGYIPDAGSTSPVFTQTVNVTTSKTTLQSSANPVTHGQKFTLTATVVPAYGTPAGTVTFKSGNTVLGSSVVSGRTKQAALSTTVQSAGKVSITATYSGTTGISGSQSSALNLTVK
jgi:probable HAF family extracellular repeat protein